MDDIYIIGIAIPIILGLIGILYRNSQASTKKNYDKIETLDKNTDDRLDKVENRLTKVETKIEK